MIACHCFEAQIRKLADLYHLEEIDSDVPLEEVIEAIPNYGPASRMRKALWQKLRVVRNNLFHDRQMPGPRETQLLMDEIHRLELDIDTGVFQNQK